MNDPAKLVDFLISSPNSYANATVSEIEAHLNNWPMPEPLRADLPAVPGFDLKLLPNALRPLVEDVTERMQTPLDFAAVVSVLSLAGSRIAEG
ncbi:hypothetical protein BDD14_0606 [Edaphobacter modestus]|uniref:Uncharacterized protein n=1 Tax=Edaphobacter modestus TaxID=388466 RepID=A0A4Q7YNM7_9BACT|nr:hypothetical protein BDD14_0606 [Edaphobacter modestus]